MKNLIALSAALALSSPALAQNEPEGAPSPNQIVDAAAADEWVGISAEDLLVMTLAPDRDGNARQVVIQLMPAPFSQGWVENIRTLSRAGWYDGISVNRVQDNYVVQWGDANHDNPAAEGKAKPLPDGLRVMDESEYSLAYDSRFFDQIWTSSGRRDAVQQVTRGSRLKRGESMSAQDLRNLISQSQEYNRKNADFSDAYSSATAFAQGFPLGITRTRRIGPNRPIRPEQVWPVHCYGMVGVGRSYSPDTGSGAELYTVIGHAPRHLDRNIALVGRVIEGIEHLSSLPRGTGPLGFYETAEERVPIQSITLASDMRAPPAFEYLSTASETFARYADARANRRDPFFIVPAGGADICNIPVPVRRVAGE